MKRFAATAILATMALSAPALAADYGGGQWAPTDQCILITPSPIAELPSRSEIRDELDKRYFHAVDVASSNRAIYSTEPTFTWANHTKASCGKAIGYLKSGEVNLEMIDRCDCFHDRMTYFRGY
jgi:hypothetical protein